MKSVVAATSDACVFMSRLDSPPVSRKELVLAPSWLAGAYLGVNPNYYQHSWGPSL